MLTHRTADPWSARATPTTPSMDLGTANDPELAGWQNASTQQHANKKPQANFGLGVRLSSAWRRDL